MDRSGDAIVRSQEELGVGREEYEAGVVGARKRVETEHVEKVVPRTVEYAGDIERVGPNDADSGSIETLPDGSVSIPILEEELVVTKRTVVRERVIIRKRTITEEHTVEAPVRRERVSIEADEGVHLEDDAAAP